LVHAYEKFDLHESYYIFFLIAGVIFLSVAIFHHKLIHHFLYIDGVFFTIEAILYAIVAADYFHEGKKALPWCYVFCSSDVLCCCSYQGKKRQRKISEKAISIVTH
jgi:hypothetical protein